MPRKLIAFHPEDLHALQELAEDRSSSLQELVDRAVADFLKASGRPANLRDALRKAWQTATRPHHDGRIPENAAKAENGTAGWT